MSAKSQRTWMFIINASGKPDLDKLKDALNHLKKIAEILKRLISKDSINARGAVFQIEKSEKGIFHLQGLIQFEREKSLSAAKKYLQCNDPLRFVRLNAVNDIERSIQYCSKKGNWVNAEGQSHYSQTIGETFFIRKDKIKDTEKTKQKTSKSASYVIDAVEKGENLLEFAKKFPDIASKHYNLFNRLTFENQYLKRLDKGFIPIEARLYWGDSETQKTRSVYEEFGYSNVYSLEIDKQGTWFNGYFQQKVLLIDDYKPKTLARQLLLKYLDGYPLKLATKGGSVPNFWDTVIITTNSYYKDIINEPALIRRFNEVVSFSANKIFREKSNYKYKKKALALNEKGELKPLSQEIQPVFLDHFNLL
jgi:hypothetical protein